MMTTSCSAASSRVVLRGVSLERRVSLAPRNRASPRLRVSAAATAGASYRPYTVRKGDTVASVAKKRGLEVEEVMKLNTGLEDKLTPGETILIPIVFSERDMEILAGIGTGQTRTYPVRKGEKINSIASSREITVAEIEALNPDMNIKKLKGGEQLVLPAGKYSLREKEILSTVMPNSALSPIDMKNLQLGGSAIIVIFLAVAAFFLQSGKVKEFREKSGK